MPESVERWSGLKAWLYSLFKGTPKSNDALIDSLGLGPDDRVLDIGCGPGASLEAAVAAGVEVVCGVDPSPSMVKRASKRAPAAVVKEGSAEKLDFDDRAFTAVWSISAFHHWADRVRGIEEMMRVIEPGGSFYLVERELDPGKSGHGMSRVDARKVADEIRTTHEIDTNVDVLAAGRLDYLVITGTV